MKNKTKVKLTATVDTEANPPTVTLTDSKGNEGTLFKDRELTTDGGSVTLQISNDQGYTLEGKYWDPNDKTNKTPFTTNGASTIMTTLDFDGGSHQKTKWGFKVIAKNQDGEKIAGDPTLILKTAKGQ